MLFIAYKLVRGDFFFWSRLDGILAVIISLLARVLVKVIAAFTGCLHMRHPYVGERASRENENVRKRAKL